MDRPTSFHATVEGGDTRLHVHYDRSLLLLLVGIDTRGREGIGIRKEQLRTFTSECSLIRVSLPIFFPSNYSARSKISSNIRAYFAQNNFLLALIGY